MHQGLSIKHHHKFNNSKTISIAVNLIQHLKSVARFGVESFLKLMGNKPMIRFSLIKDDFFLPISTLVAASMGLEEILLLADHRDGYVVR